MKRHVQITVGYLEQALEKGVVGWLTLDGKPAPLQEQQDYLAELKAEGYQFIPCCDNTDAVGKCRGS